MKCPRNCDNKLMSRTPAGFNPNPKSPVDGIQVCLDCYVKESINDRVSRSNPGKTIAVGDISANAFAVIQDSL